MNLKKRAAGAIAVAMSVVVMTSVAQAAPADYKTGVASQATTTDLATNGIAGIAVSMSQYESDAYEYIGLADANVEQMNVARVTSGDAAEQDADAAEEGLTEMTVDVADADTAVQAENAASGTETDVSTETAGSEQTEITQIAGAGHQKPAGKPGDACHDCGMLPRGADGLCAQETVDQLLLGDRDRSWPYFTDSGCVYRRFPLLAFRCPCRS